MKFQIIKKQQNSKMCLVCGMKNELGLKSAFYELENGELVALFKTKEEHQSYPERLHGGIAGAILDETIGRAIMIKNAKIWGVTLELNVKFRKPIPLNKELKAVGRITKDSSKIFEGTGEIYLDNGEIAAIATGKYLKMPIEKITRFDEQEEEWQIVTSADEPCEIEIY